MTDLLRILENLDSVSEDEYPVWARLVPYLEQNFRVIQDSSDSYLLSVFVRNILDLFYKEGWGHGMKMSMCLSPLISFEVADTYSW